MPAAAAAFGLMDVMKVIRHRLLRLRYLWPLAAACGAAGLIYGRFGAREGGLAAARASRTLMAETTDSRPAARFPRDLVGAWSETLKAERTRHPVITITGRQSVQREQAFRKLLDGTGHDNVAEVYRMLRSGEIMPSESEWHAFMEKWGRLDGPDAVAQIEADDGTAIPGLLRGWASVDPPAAKAWLEERLDGGTSEAWHLAARREMILGWVQADSSGAADWLNEHWESPGYAEIAAAFAEEMGATDPKNAMEWARSVEGPWRKWALERVGRKWLERDRPAATEALQAAGLGEEEIDPMILRSADGFDLLDPAVPIGEGLPGVSFAEE